MSWINVTAAGANALACAVFNPLKIAVVNVGQGNATLVMAPNGKNYLIDSGYKEHTNTGESNEATILKVLQVEGREPVIHGVIASHYDSDHVEGFIDCTDNPLLPTELLIDNAGVVNWGTFSSYEDCRNQYADSLPQGEDMGYIPIGENGENLGTTIDLGQGWEIVILAGGGYVYAGDDDPVAVPNATTENSHSLVVGIRGGAFFMVTMNDATGPEAGSERADVESVLVEELAEQGYDDISVLNVGHHGARNATGPNNEEETGFVESLTPEVAYISVGEQRTDYGHPAQETLDTLDDNDSVDYVLQTDCGHPSEDNQVCDDNESDKRLIVGTTIVQPSASGSFKIYTPVPEDNAYPYFSRSIFISCDTEGCASGSSY